MSSGQLGLAGGSAAQDRAIVHAERNAIARQKVGNIVQVCDDAFKLQAFARHHRDQALMQRLSASLVFRLRFALAVLHQQTRTSGESSAAVRLPKLTR